GAATVWFLLNGERKVLSCNRWPEYRRNLRALYFTAESLRLASQRGILEQYRQFFQALPAPGATQEPDEDPYTVLGLAPGAPADVAEAAYRTLAKRAHADAGGSDAAMRRLNIAIGRIRQERQPA